MNHAKEINDYIAARNAEFVAHCKASGAQWWCVNGLNADDLAKYGVHTLAEYIIWQKENEALEKAKDDRKNGY
jgi:hypothetical protein